MNSILSNENSLQELTIRLSSEFVQAAISLSDEFHMNELEAAAILYEAREPAARRSDRDVLAAAREMYLEERRELLLCAQEVLRASIAWDRGQQGFEIDELVRWRDILVTEPELWEGATLSLIHI